MIEAKGGKLERARFKLVIFHGGKRIEKLVVSKQTLETYHELRRRGVKIAVVSRVQGYWPKNRDPGPEVAGQLWCPYCRTWRWFDIPDSRDPSKYPPMSEGWMDALHRNVLNSTETPWCKWCHISLADFAVKQMNDMWGWAPRKRRARRTRTTRTRRRR